jgi:hypothetical protein
MGGECGVEEECTYVTDGKTRSREVFEILRRMCVNFEPRSVYLFPTQIFISTLPTVLNKGPITKIYFNMIKIV